MLAYGLGFLAAFRHLQWPPGGSVGRLPAGGPAIHGSVLYRVRDGDRDSDNENEDCLIATCNHLPEEAPSRVTRRPVCVVFDETDPISALERSFDLSSANTSAGTQTIFVEHKSTQTDDSGNYKNVSQMSDKFTQYEYAEPANSEKPVKKEKTKQPRKPKEEPKEVQPSAHYYPNIPLSRDSFVKPKQQNVIQKMIHWKRNFLDMQTVPKVEHQMGETSQRRAKREQDTDSMSNELLNELLQKVDRQEKQVRQLQQALDSFKHEDRNISNFADTSIFAKKKSPFLQPVTSNRKCDASTWTSFCSEKSTQSKTPLNSKNEANVKLSSKVEFAAQTSSSNMLHAQYSSECQLCAGKSQPVLDDLIEKLLQLIGNRRFEDVVVTVLLRADNVYHVNVQEKHSKLNLGCLLSTHAAIEKAAKRGFFNQFLTYTVTDIRNTITSPTPNFGFPFEFVSQEETPMSQVCDNNNPHQCSDSAVYEFITKVLRMPADNIN